MYYNFHKICVLYIFTILYNNSYNKYIIYIYYNISKSCIDFFSFHCQNDEILVDYLSESLQHESLLERNSHLPNIIYIYLYIYIL